MVIGLKPGGLAHPLPVVVTTGKEAAATKRPGGPTHESYWAGRARVCRPSGPFAFLCDRNRGLRPRQRMCQPSRLQGGKCWNCCQWSEARSAGRSSAYGGNPRSKSGERWERDANLLNTLSKKMCRINRCCAMLRVLRHVTRNQQPQTGLPFANSSPFQKFFRR